MNFLKKRLSIISQVLIYNPSIGKTAIMKLIFFLQKVYKLPLDYNYRIYTYGPYSSEVSEDIDLAYHEGLLTSTIVMYGNGVYGYNIKPTQKSKDYISDEIDYIKPYKDSIKELISLFSNKNAKQLELYSTIVYLYDIAKSNAWDDSQVQIAEDVHAIKPHFEINTIQLAYEDLENWGLFKKLVS